MSSRVTSSNMSFGRSCKECERPIRQLKVYAQPTKEHGSTADQWVLKLACTLTKYLQGKPWSVKEILVKILSDRAAPCFSGTGDRRDRRDRAIHLLLAERNGMRNA
jgi:hypothetical protein